MQQAPGDCLHRSNSSGAIDAWDCESTGGDYSSIVWTHYPNGTIVSAVDGQCLTAGAVSISTSLCVNSTAAPEVSASQNFTVDAMGRLSAASAPGSCVFVNLSNPEPTPRPGGANVVGDTCKTGSAKQAWKLTAQPGGNATLCVNETSGLQRCLAASTVPFGGSHGPNVVAAASNDTGVTPLQWQLRSSGGNTTVVASKQLKCLGEYSGNDCECLNLTHSSDEPEPGLNAELWQCGESTDSMVWQYDEGTGHLTSPYGGLCLEAVF